MPNLKGKHIILGITGSIAAYKTPALVRLLVKAGATVQVILSEKAADFVSPLSLSTVSGRSVLTATHDNGQWHNHALMGRQADYFLMAPASANTLSKMAHGLCDNMLLAVYLSAACPVGIAPAMDEDMWHHPATQKNIKTLKSFGHKIIPVASGELASGLIGEGRMAEPEEIVSFLRQQLEDISTSESASHKKALVTAGPTYESIDPVRFIGNHSTGKMGNAFALALAEKGYEVTLVIGPGVPPPKHPLIHVHPIVSTREMFKICKRVFSDMAITVMAAAVSDYRPAQKAHQKIKKNKSPNEHLSIDLVQNPDILATLGKEKTNKQLLIGFALETENELDNAINKVKTKKADYIILNSLNDKGAGFGTDTNKVIIISSEGDKIPLPLQSKETLAKTILAKVLTP